MTIRFLVCFLLGWQLMTPASPAMAQNSQIARQLMTVTRHLDHPEARPNPKYFDGTRIILPPYRFRVAVKWFLALNSRLKRAIVAFGKLSPSTRGTPSGRALHKRLYKRQQYGKAVYAALDKAEAAHKAWAKSPSARSMSASGRPLSTSRAACVHFNKVALKSAPSDGYGGRIMRQFMKGEGSLSLESMKKHRAILDRVAAECAKPIAKDLPPKGKCNRNYRAPQYDPRTWCEAAAKTDEIMAGFARNYAAWRVQQATVGLRVERIKKEAWLPITRPVRYADLTSASKRNIAAARKSIEPVLKFAGLPVDPLLDAKAMSKISAHFAPFKAAIDKSAVGLKTPRGRSHYSSKKAARQVRKRLGKGARVIKHVLGKGWTIKYKTMQNVRTGALRKFPKYRAASGYVLTRVAGDELCQLRQFTVYEYTKKASRRFRRAKDVTLGYVRFQKCR